MDLNANIFELMSLPFLQIGNDLFVLSEVGKVRNVRFNDKMQPFAFGGLDKPWQRVWARGWQLEQGADGKYFCSKNNCFLLNKATNRCQIFDQSDFPIGIAEGFYPSASIIQELGDYAVLGRNSFANAGGMPVGSVGYSLYHLDDKAFFLLNKEPIPCFVFFSWTEGGNIFLAGMTARTPLPDDADFGDGNYKRGRPVLVKCFPDEKRWEEVDFMSVIKNQGDFLSQWPNSFKFDGSVRRGVTKAEVWLGGEATLDGDRILLAGMGAQRLPVFDSLDVDGEYPEILDYNCVALVSLNRQEIVSVFQQCCLLCSLATPLKTIFMLKNIAGDGEVFFLNQLFGIDPLASGIEPFQFAFNGLPSDVAFLNNFKASFFDSTGFFGVIESIDGRRYFLNSGDGVEWHCIASSVDIETSNLSDLM